MSHVCAPSLDPRRQGSCYRCGKLLPAPELEPDLRDEAFETEATLTAARQAGVDGRALDAFARARTLPGPVRDHATRDLRLEVLEELADGRNYIVWSLEQARAAGTLTVERQHFLMGALGALAVAWHHVEAAYQS